jgi:signal transduction histidine kinase
VRPSESPYLADWFAISFRWLAILALAITLARFQQFNAGGLAALGVSMAWNLAMSILAVVNARLGWHRALNVAVDSLCALLAFIAAGGVIGPASWAGVLVIAPASVYFGLRGGLLSALGISLAQAVYSYFALPSPVPAVPLAALAGLNLAVGLDMGLLSRALVRRLRETYFSLVKSRRENETRIRLRERDRMKTLSEMIATFSATLNYKTVLEAAMNSSISTMGLTAEEASPLLCAFFLFEDANLAYMMGQGFPAHDQTVRLPAEEGILAEALRTGEHRLAVVEQCNDPELCELVALHPCKSILVLPLIRGMNAYGAVLYAHPDPAFFTPDRTELVLTIANQTVIAIQNARLFQDLSAEKERLIQSQEEAQKKLARDLHDGPTQSVSSVAMRLSIARRMLESDPAAVPGELEQIEELARNTAKEIRHMLFTLRPLVLESEGLIAALEAMAVKMHDVYQQNLHIDVDPEVIQQLDASKQTVVFYLSEEAVNNARKYAEATQVTVKLQFITPDHSLAGLEISDNGRGFNVAEVLGSYESRGSLGMVNLRERTDLINGLLKVDSVPGQGTRIRVYIPLNEAAVDRLHRS